MQIHARRSASTGSDETDELPLQGREMQLGIERRIEFSVEADQRSGFGEGEASWGRDLERAGSRDGFGGGRFDGQGRFER